MSLVADYSDSSSDDKEKEANLSVLVNPSSNSTTDNPSTSTNNRFFASPESSSDDNDKSEDEEEEQDKTANKRKGTKGERCTILENPFRYFGSGSVSAEDSVLRVEFREQAAQKTALMERHVKMTETDGAAEKINGKTVCWQNRKGKCRFGHNCKFAHDSDIVNPEGENVPKKTFKPTEKLSPGLVAGESEQSPSVVTFASGAHLSGDNSGKRKSSVGMISDDEDESGDKKSGKKKRPGLSSTLVPGKKVMGMYYKSKSTQ